MPIAFFSQNANILLWAQNSLKSFPAEFGWEIKVVEIKLERELKVSTGYNINKRQLVIPHGTILAVICEDFQIQPRLWVRYMIYA